MAEKLRVTHVVETLDMGGAENVVASIAAGLATEFDVSICCLKRSGPVADRVPPSVKVLELRQREGNDVRTPFRLARLLRRGRADVVHSHGWGTFCESAAAAILAGTPVRLHTAHGLHQGYPPGDRLRRIKEPVRRAAERALARTVGRIVAVSDEVKRDVTQTIGIPEEKVVVIRNGVVPMEPAPDQAQKCEIGWRAGDFVVCAVGRLAPVKNYSRLLEAAALLGDLAGRLKVVLVGDGPERAGLEALIADLSLKRRVFLAGERDDVANWLSFADAFALPSAYEGISVALLEAMSAGVPPVVTRVGGNTEVVRDGENGLVVRPDDAAALAGALRDLFWNEGRRRALGAAARRTAWEEFGLARAIAAYEDIYRESANTSRPPLAERPAPPIYVRNRGNL